MPTGPVGSNVVFRVFASRLEALLPPGCSMTITTVKLRGFQ
jgi:hypothetical protein